ncbi:DUF2339 domain-containing protein [Sphingomonas sp.]|uniref:DUF2339 domain-containing protein n=1 Tax=Sphingomonas sp. TaxID=28214 RepID=UPI003CC5CE26
MLTVIVLALIGALAKLWVDVVALRDRVRALEWGGAPRLAPLPTGWGAPGPQPWEAPPVAYAHPQPAARVVGSAQFAEDNAHDGVADSEPLPDAPFSFRGLNGDGAAPLDERLGAPSDSNTSPDEEGLNAATPAQDDVGAAPAPARSLGFEDIFGRKLPIWAGGVTLAVCGFLIVKYSIDAGLLSPLVRVIGGLLFGLGLIAGAEAALQNEERVRDPRVRQALSGAGVATLYATTLVAANLYHLIPPLAAFLFMAATTVVAGALSIRFGAPSAVLGLVGGLAAPALVGTGNPNVPLLAAYLALAVGGLAALGRAQRWWWLGVAALAGGFGWGAVLIGSGALALADALSVGAFVLMLGVGLPVLLFGGRQGHVVRLVGTLVAAAQLAALIATGGFALLTWGLFGLLGLASVWLSRREAPLADLPVPALLTALFLMSAWPLPQAHDFTLVLAGAAAIFGLPAAWRVGRNRGTLGDAGSVAAFAAAPLALWLVHFDPSTQTSAGLALLGAAAASAVAGLVWPDATRRWDARFAVLTGAAAVLLAVAAAFGLAPFAVAPAWAVIAAGLVMLARTAQDRRVEGLAWTLGAAIILLLVIDIERSSALVWAAGMHVAQPGWRVILTWAVPAAAALVFGRFMPGRAAAPIGNAVAVLVGYVAVAQALPQPLLPLVPAIGAAALGYWRRPDAATITAGGLAAAWALWPMLTWLAGVGGAVIGFPLYVGALPGLADATTRLLAPAAAAAIVLWRHPPEGARLRQGWLAALALLGGAFAHVAYKQLFAIGDHAAFVRLGLAERTLWEALLAATAMLLARRLPQASRGLGIAAAAHLVWFTLLLHDPLWSEQAVGPLPVLNLLLPAYALAFGLLWAAGRTALPSLAERARGWAQMLLILLFAATELRQLVHGAILAGGGVAPAEDITRSLLAIAIAVGFLVYGIRARLQDWRVASLAVMLGAVGKVFLLDASGLDGLLRIASFAALGFSLIGIGWLYSRYLPDDAPISSGVNPVVAANG